jgi:hypothetical protein
MALVIGYPTLGSAGNIAESPQQLQNAGFEDGWYNIQGVDQTQPLLMYVFMNLVNSKAWAVVTSATYASTADINLLGYSIPWTGLAVRRVSTTSITNRSSNIGPETAYFDSERTFNQSNSTVTSNGSGTRVGYRVFLGFAGGHGIFTTSQNVCDWGSATSGAIGAGWNGITCGSFPNGLIWGTGTGTGAEYANRSGYWQVLINWE